MKSSYHRVTRFTTWVLACLMMIVAASASLAKAAPLALPGWRVSQVITINNTTNPANLTDYQVKVVLSAGNFDFAHAQPDGGDIRFTENDGVTPLSYWIESFDSGSQSAVIWVRVPSIPASSTKQIQLWYSPELINRPATTTANGDATFEFFDDFESPTPGYFELGAATEVMSQTLDWENSAPHTLSVVEVNPADAEGYTYYGYYGLQDCYGGVARARSTDLINWVKDPTPIITDTGSTTTGEDARWPSVVISDSVYYMVYNNQYCYNTRIVYRTSTDGVDFGPAGDFPVGDSHILVPYDGSQRHVNPDLFLNPNDNLFYLYYTDIDTGDSNNQTIKVRSAANVPALKQATDTVLLSTTTGALAAPNMLYYNGVYYLSTETLDQGGYWITNVYASASPTGPFTLLGGNPVLSNGGACMSQRIFGGVLHNFYCQLTGATWTIEHRAANPAALRPDYPNTNKWTRLGGSWSVVTATQPAGDTGRVAMATTGAVEILASNTYSGTDYIVEANGQQINGRVWGLGVRATDQNNFYSTNLYEDLDAVNNLYLYDWTAGTPTAVASTAVGTIELNTWYSVGVSAHGTTLEVYSGTLHTTVTDSAHASGAIALIGEAGTTAHFDNVRVRQYTTPEPTLIFEAPTAISLKTLAAQASTPTMPSWLIVAGVIMLSVMGWRTRRRPGKLNSGDATSQGLPE